MSLNQDGFFSIGVLQETLHQKDCEIQMLCREREQ